MIGRTYLEHGQAVTVLVRWSGKGPRNVLIQRGDGTKVVRPFRGLRKPPPTLDSPENPAPKTSRPADR
jgi:acetyl esterase